MSTPAYLNSSPSPFPFIEPEEDQQLQYFSPHQASSSSLSSPIFFNITDQDHQEPIHPREPQKIQHKVDNYILHGGSSDNRAIPSSSSAQPTIDSSSSTNNTTRTCSDCNTTKTPLWRSGPQGPKSLCNACGIRQRKARRAMLAAAAAAANGMVLARATDNSTRIKVKDKEKKSGSTSFVGQYKKPFKLHGSPQDREKISFEDFALSLSKNSAFRRAFPKDEEEAAILLMALSCGLLHS